MLHDNLDARRPQLRVGVIGDQGLSGSTQGVEITTVQTRGAFDVLHGFPGTRLSLDEANIYVRAVRPSCWRPRRTSGIPSLPSSELRPRLLTNTVVTGPQYLGPSALLTVATRRVPAALVVRALGESQARISLPVRLSVTNALMEDHTKTLARAGTGVAVTLSSAKCCFAPRTLQLVYPEGCIWLWRFMQAYGTGSHLKDRGVQVQGLRVKRPRDGFRQSVRHTLCTLS